MNGVKVIDCENCLAEGHRLQSDYIIGVYDGKTGKLIELKQVCKYHAEGHMKIPLESDKYTMGII
jgi:hypothetical protein